MWVWGLHYTRADWNAISEEIHEDRRDCEGFIRYSPGRTPNDHFKLETDAIEFRRKLWLGLLPLLYGAIGAAIGWLLRP